MKKFSGLLLVCGMLGEMKAANCRRLYEDQFRVNVRTPEWNDNFDLRDLLKFDTVAWVLRDCQLQVNDSTARIEKQLKVYDIYEEVLAQTNCCINDTYDIYENNINQQIRDKWYCEYFEDFKERVDPVDMFIPFSAETVHFVCLLTSVWCDGLEISLNDDNVVEILRAFAYLQINNEKQVDVFITGHKTPQHLRIKIINLFCINFVYLLQKNGLLSKYKALLEYSNLALEDNDKKLVAAFQLSEKPLLKYIHLLKIELEDGHVSKLFLCSNSRYFAYEHRYQEQCKVIALKHERNITDSISKLDLIVELNTLNKTMEKRRLDVLMPFFDDFFSVAYSRPKSFPSDTFVQEFYCYIEFIEILNELKEVYIYNLLPYYRTLPNPIEAEEDSDSFLPKMVKAVIRKLPGLHSLFIQGFDEFPLELIPLLKGAHLKKFGAMGNCGKVDYLVIHRLFSEECVLKKTIRHFIGHCRAVHFFSQFYEEKHIVEATVFNWIFGMDSDLSEEDNAYSLKIKLFFSNGSLTDAVHLEKSINIGTVYYMEPTILMLQAAMRAERTSMSDYRLAADICFKITASEFLSKCAIDRLIVRFEKDIDFIQDITTLSINEGATTNTVEVIVEGNMHMYIRLLAPGGRRRCNNNLCFIINLDASMMLCKAHELNCHTALGICRVFQLLIAYNDETLALKIRLRRRVSERIDCDNIKSLFIEFYKEKPFYNDSVDFSKISFEEIICEFSNPTMRAIRL
ncbi:hypothetical protein ENBRE01_1599 [Enteropsectra breve]|nr:hypothetical protein ENBRE01_1599 [Enteropsectra breve]